MNSSRLISFSLFGHFKSFLMKNSSTLSVKPKILPMDEVVSEDDPGLTRYVLPCDKYNHSGLAYDKIIDKFMGIMTKEGKREMMRDVMRKTIAEVKAIQLQKYKSAPEDEKKDIELNPVPCPPSSEADAIRMSIKLIAESAREKNPSTRIWVSLARELVNITHNEGKTNKKIADLYKKCEENKARLCLARKQTFQHDLTRERRVRNVGIIAHIDAGKTTTTEHLLHVSGKTSYAGTVDHGDTITDFMDEERNRGITISNASAYLYWRNHSINLIDTPGHVDFNNEVERTLSVVDGAMIILDATRGVQAQTKTVWGQANRFKLPRMVYINKMDRAAASLEQCLMSMNTFLGQTVSSASESIPLLISTQHPIFSKNNQDKTVLNGIVDLINMKLKIGPYQTDGGNIYPFEAVKDIKSLPIHMDDDCFEGVLNARRRLLEDIAMIDDDFADLYLSTDNSSACLSPADIKEAIKKVTLKNAGIPVMIGSSLCDIGMEDILDGMIDYLPDPLYKSDPEVIEDVMRVVKLEESSLSNSERAEKTVLLIFQIVPSEFRDMICLARIYYGKLLPGMLLHNINIGKEDKHDTEKVGKLMNLTGNLTEEVKEATPGSIVAISGLKSACNGDILVDKCLRTAIDENTLKNSEVEEDLTFCKPWLSPDPVVYASVLPGSRSDIKPMEYGLKCLQRIDPSFSWSFAKETGQWIVKGQGDLHLEVSIARLCREHRVRAKLGSLHVAYREVPVLSESSGSLHSKIQPIEINRKHSFMRFDFKLRILESEELTGNSLKYPQNKVTFDRQWLNKVVPYTDGKESSLMHQYQRLMNERLMQFLHSAGGLIHSPVSNVHLHCQRLMLSAEQSHLESEEPQLHAIFIPLRTMQSKPVKNQFVNTAVRMVRSVLQEMESWTLLEPYMELELRLDESQTLSPFTSELHHRGVHIQSLQSERLHPSAPPQQVVRAAGPLGRLHGLSSALRALAHGHIEVHLRLADYQPLRGPVEHLPPQLRARLHMAGNLTKLDLG